MKNVREYHVMIQLIPAQPGWESCWTNDDGTTYTEPVIMWALCETWQDDNGDKNTARRVVGTAANTIETVSFGTHGGEDHIGNFDVDSECSNYRGYRKCEPR